MDQLRVPGWGQWRLLAAAGRGLEGPSFVHEGAVSQVTGMKPVDVGGIFISTPESLILKLLGTSESPTGLIKNPRTHQFSGSKVEPASEGRSHYSRPH